MEDTLETSLQSAEDEKLLAALATEHSTDQHFTMIDVSSRRERRSLILGAGVNHPTMVEDESVTTADDSAGADSLFGSLEEGKVFEHKRSLVAQIPAILVATLLVLMGAVPFGVAYFPIGWRDLSSVNLQDEATDEDDDGIQGTFPLHGKSALGIRMCLFSTLMGQLAMTYTSNFSNPIVFQLVENVPFYHALASIVIAEQGYGVEALTTLFFLFGLGSILVGAMFYLVGKCRLGRVVYFFPSHVLMGLIGGIGVFVAKTAVEVTTNTMITFDLDGLTGLVEKWHHFSVVAVLEILLRLVTTALTGPNGELRFPLLSPIFFCAIIPAFYLGMWILGVDFKTAKERDYFLPDPIPPCNTADCSSPSLYDRIFDGHIWDMFTIFLNFRSISWTAVSKSMGTLFSMAAFSFLQVPIMIPAFAVSSNVDIDMDRELIAHGWSNGLAGVFGGLQNVMTYSFSILYHKSGGDGKISSLIIVALTAGMFVVGPSMVAFLPRAMAGTLLLHIGVDLLLEGVYDSFGVYDSLEYAGIWFITIVMTSLGMTAGLIAGGLSAVSTYAVQSITNLDPIFRIIPATTLRSSVWIRSPEAAALLRNPRSGRARILVVQLQGHLFFGNIVSMSDSIKSALEHKKGSDDQPLVVILDFSLVVGLDSSAAQTVVKLKHAMQRSLHVEATVFVTGSHRSEFPCNYELAKELNKPSTDTPSEITSLLPAIRENTLPSTRVFNSLDEALVFAEDFLIARFDLAVWAKEEEIPRGSCDSEEQVKEIPLWTERRLAEEFIENLAPIDDTFNVKDCVPLIVSKCKRECITKQGHVIWREGDESTCLKLLLTGKLIASLEGTDITEYIFKGSLLGELGLIHGAQRLSTVKTASTHTVLYSLDRDAWREIAMNHPSAARLLDRITIRYLAHRVQHVSNRIFETRCLPI